MAHRILIPTPLRPFAGKQDVVERRRRAPSARSSQALTARYGDLRSTCTPRTASCGASSTSTSTTRTSGYLEREQTALKAGDTVSIVPSVAGGVGAASCSAKAQELSRDEIQRYSRHLIMPEVGIEGQQQAEGGARAAASAPAGSARPRRCIWPRPASARSASSISTSSTAATCSARSCTAPPDVGRPKLRGRDATGCWRSIPTVKVVHARRRADLEANALDIFATTTSSSTAPTTSRPAISSTTPACCSASRTSTAASSASTGRRRCSRPRAARATAASTRSRRRRGWCRAAPKAACSACCPASSACIQATEAIKLILGIGEPLVGRLLLFDALQMSSASSSCAAIPSARCAATTRPSTS